MPTQQLVACSVSSFCMVNKGSFKCNVLTVRNRNGQFNSSVCVVFIMTLKRLKEKVSENTFLKLECMARMLMWQFIVCYFNGWQAKIVLLNL